MMFDQGEFKVFMLVGGALILAACGGDERAGEKENSTGADEPAGTAPAPPPADTADGAWYYKESNGYPWAGYGPPRSEAFFVISCREGRIVLHRSGARDPSEGPETYTLRLAKDEHDIVMEDTGAELPMLEGSLSPGADIVGLLLETRAPFALEGGGKDIVLPADESYRRVIRACRGE